MILDCNPCLAKYSTFGSLNSHLHFVAVKGHNEIVSLLLENEVDANSRNYCEQTHSLLSASTTSNEGSLPEKGIELFQKLHDPMGSVMMKKKMMLMMGLFVLFIHGTLSRRTPVSSSWRAPPRPREATPTVTMRTSSPDSPTASHSPRCNLLTALKVVDACGGRVTIGDVVGRAGLKLKAT
ncbi:hypothetical protein EV2_045754 [Malus domestica]